MKWILLGIMLFGMAITGYAYSTLGGSGNAEDKMGAGIIALIGFVIIGLDALAFLIWAFVKL